MRLAIIARKGGVGKTTTAINLAAGLAAGGGRSLLIDLDSQGSVGVALGLAAEDLVPSLADVVLDGAPLESAVREHVSTPRLTFAPCDRRFRDAGARLARLAAEERLRVLSDVLETTDSYDHVVIDTAGLGLVTLNALVACDLYMLVLQPEKLSLDGLRQVRHELAELSAQHGITARQVGVLFTMVDSRIVAVREVIAEARRALGGEVFTTEIPRTTRLAEAPWAGKPILSAFPDSAGARAYEEFTREVMWRAAGLGVV